MSELSRINKVTNDFQGLNEETAQSPGRCSYAPRFARTESITKPICGPSGSCVLWFKDFASAGEEVSEKASSRCTPGFAPARRTGSPLVYTNLEPGLSLQSYKQAKNQMRGH
jgi:hypothetical protein